MYLFTTDKLLCNENTERGCVDVVLGVFYDLVVSTGDHSKQSIVNHSINLMRSLPCVLHTPAP